jgi:long-chain fatty acid transport protein
MKKLLCIFAMIMLFMFTSSSVMAQMDNLTNMSAEWMRTSNRNAAIDATDIVVYNPAATVLLPEGFHINIGNQTLIRKPQHTFDLGFGKGEQSFEQDKADPFLPNLFAAYRKDKWAINGGIYIPGGGATVNYPTGSLTTELISFQTINAYNGQLEADYTAANNQLLKASSYYIAFAIGGAYAINDKFSVSLGARYLTCKNLTKAGMTLSGSVYGFPDIPLQVDTRDNATGFGGIIGANFKPNDDWNIGLHYETAVKLDFKTKINKDDLGFAEDGAMSRRDLPANLNTGISYKLTTALMAEVDFNYYFQKAADWSDAYLPGDTIKTKWADMAGNCYTVGLALLYDVNTKLQVSAGTSWTKFLFDNKEGYYTGLGAFEVLKNDNLTLNLGGAYRVCSHAKFNLAFGTTLWKDQSIESLQMKAIQVYSPDPSASSMVATKDNAMFIALGFEIDL